MSRNVCKYREEHETSPKKRVVSFNCTIYFIRFSVQAVLVLQQANKGLVALRHYVESHNGRISDEVNHFYFSLLIINFISRLFNLIQIWFIGLFKFLLV
jgi:hypothetical protein